MASVAVCIVLGVINLILLGILYFHFRSKNFSEKIIADGAKILQEISRDINNMTAQCITVVTDGEEKLNQLIADAKKYTNLAYDGFDQRLKNLQIMEEINRDTRKKKIRTSYSDLVEGSHISRGPIQHDLFETNVFSEKLLNKIDEEEMQSVDVAVPFVSVNNEGKEDVVIPEINIAGIELPELIRESQRNVKIESELRTRVLELHSEGFDVDTIASKLDVTVTEVDLIVRLYGI